MIEPTEPPTTLGTIPAFEPGNLPATLVVTKPGWKTTEFWVVVAPIVAAVVEPLRDRLGGSWALVAACVAAGAYAVARGLAKRP